MIITWLSHDTHQRYGLEASVFRTHNTLTFATHNLILQIPLEKLIALIQCLADYASPANKHS